MNDSTQYLVSPMLTDAELLDIQLLVHQPGSIPAPACFIVPGRRPQHASDAKSEQVPIVVKIDESKFDAISRAPATVTAEVVTTPAGEKLGVMSLGGGLLQLPSVEAGGWIGIGNRELVVTFMSETRIQHVHYRGWKRDIGQDLWLASLDSTGNGDIVKADLTLHQIKLCGRSAPDVVLNVMKLLPSDSAPAERTASRVFSEDIPGFPKARLVNGIATFLHDCHLTPTDVSPTIVQLALDTVYEEAGPYRNSHFWRDIRTSDVFDAIEVFEGSRIQTSGKNLGDLEQFRNEVATFLAANHYAEAAAERLQVHLWFEKSLPETTQLAHAWLCEKFVESEEKSYLQYAEEKGPSAVDSALEMLAYVESLRTSEPKRHRGAVAAERFKVSRQRLMTDAA